MIRFIYTGKWQKKNINQGSINGYALWISLAAFFLLCQIVGYMSVYTMQNSYLIQCNKQSKLDLSVVSWAKHIIDNNTMVRICHLPDEKMIHSQTILMDDIEVYLEDKNTYIDCLYNGVEMKVYYDDKCISGIEFH